MNKRKLLRVTASFFVMMLIFTVLSRAADQAGIAVVRVAKPENRVIAHEVKASGKVVQNQELAVTTEPGQRVESIEVAVGQRVEKGELLFSVDLDLLEEQILRQQMELEKQELSVKDAKSQGEVSEAQKANEQAQAAEQYSLSTQSANARLSRAGRDLKAAKKKLSDFLKTGGQTQEDSEVEAALAKTAEEKLADYLAAKQELESLEWTIENAVYQAQQRAAQEAALQKNEAVRTQAAQEAALQRTGAVRTQAAQEAALQRTGAVCTQAAQEVILEEEWPGTEAGSDPEEKNPQAEPIGTGTDTDESSFDLSEAASLSRAAESFDISGLADAGDAGEIPDISDAISVEDIEILDEAASDDLSAVQNPPMIDPPVTDPSVTDPSAADLPVTDPSAADLSVTDLSAEDLPVTDPAAGSIPADTLIVEGVSPNNPSVGESTSGNISSGSTSSDEALPGSIPSGNSPSDETLSGDVPSGSTPFDETLSGDVPSGSTPSDDAISGDVSSGSTSSDNISSGDLSSGSIPSGDILSGDTPSEAPSGGTSATDPLPGTSGSGQSGAGTRLSQSELDEIERKVRDDYAQELANARKKEETALAEYQNAQQALSRYREEQLNALEGQDDATKKQLLQEVQAAQDAYEDAAISANSAAVTGSRAVQTAGIPNASNSQERTGEITYEQMELELKKLESLRAQGGKVRSPADGLITKINIMTGEKTSDTTAILMADLSKGCHFTAEITKEQEKYIGTGDTVALTGSNRKKLENVTVDSVTADEENEELYHVRVQLPADLFENGASLTLEFTKKSDPYMLCVPLSALHLDEKNQPYVLVPETYETVMGTEVRARKVSVTVLEKNESSAALAEGGAVSTQDQVITNSNRAVDDGSRVRIEE